MKRTAGTAKGGHRLVRHGSDSAPVNGTVYVSVDDPRLQHDLGRACIGTDPALFPDRLPFALVPVAELRSPFPGVDVMLRYGDARIEGHWRTVEDPAKVREGRPVLPWPTPSAPSWSGREEFLSSLSVVERSAGGLAKHHFMGSSDCRICGCDNGTHEFYDARPNAAHGWRWPGGFAHYVESHGIEPSVAFQCYVAWRSRNLRAA